MLALLACLFSLISYPHPSELFFIEWLEVKIISNRLADMSTVWAQDNTFFSMFLLIHISPLQWLALNRARSMLATDLDVGASLRGLLATFLVVGLPSSFLGLGVYHLLRFLFLNVKNRIKVTWCLGFSDRCDKHTIALQHKNICLHLSTCTGINACARMHTHAVSLPLFLVEVAVPLEAKVGAVDSRCQGAADSGCGTTATDADPRRLIVSSPNEWRQSRTKKLVLGFYCPLWPPMDSSWFSGSPVNPDKWESKLRIDSIWSHSFICNSSDWPLKAAHNDLACAQNFGQPCSNS